MSDDVTRDLGLLREIRDEELELMLSWRNHPNVRQNMYTRHEISLDEHLAWWRRTKKNPTAQYWMYEFNNLPMGIIGFASIDFVNRNASWSFYANPEAPHGLGSRMEFLALDHAFTALRLHKLWCEVLSLNKPVLKLHERFGFQQEGLFREHHKYDDKYVDVYRLGILATEWQQRRPHMREKLYALLRTH